MLQEEAIAFQHHVQPRRRDLPERGGDRGKALRVFGVPAVEGAVDRGQERHDGVDMAAQLPHRRGREVVAAGYRLGIELEPGHDADRVGGAEMAEAFEGVPVGLARVGVEHVDDGVGGGLSRSLSP